MTTTDFLSETGFAMIFLGMLVVAVFRKEAKNAFVRVLEIAKGFLHR